MVEKLFSRPGSKLKGLAKVFFWIIAISGIILALVMMYAVASEVNLILGILAGILYAAIMILCAWLSTLSLYATGELVEDVSTIRKTIQAQTDD